MIAPGGLETLFGTLLSILLVLNVLLAAFNLIPLPPLDGASVVGLFVPAFPRRMRELSTNPMFSMIGLLIAWRVFPLIVRPLFSFVVWLVHPGVRYG